MLLLGYWIPAHTFLTIPYMGLFRRAINHTPGSAWGEFQHICYLETITETFPYTKEDLRMIRRLGLLI